MYNPTKSTKESVLTMIQSTWKNPYLEIQPSTYAIFKKKFAFPEVDHTDGIGTKGFYHWKKKTFKNAVIDALAMNLNDLALVRAIPYKLQNHIVLPKDDNKAILDIMSTLVSECKKRNIAITGGETSIHDNSDSLDIGITMSGFIKKIVPNVFKKNDVLIGLASNGLHSNGITKVRQLFKNQIRKELTHPTEIYIDHVSKITEKFPVNGMMHITGGAFTKLKDLLKNTDAHIYRDHNLEPQSIFYEIYKKGMSDKNMYRTFNCGIGFILSTPKDYAEKIVQKHGGEIIGEVVEGDGNVIIESKFSQKTILL